MLVVKYQIKAYELSRANSLFIEEKPFLKLLINSVNVLVILIIFYTILRVLNGAFYTDFTVSDIMANIFGIFWLFYRRNFHIKIAKKTLSNLEDETICLEFGENGVTHKVQQKTLRLKWREIKKIYYVKNGFIATYNDDQFLWLPFRGFSGDKNISDFKKLIDSKNTKAIKFLDYVC